MNNLLDIPILSITGLTPERAVVVLRTIFRAECGYAKLSSTALTISSRLTTADGGIDAEIITPPGASLPADCLFQHRLTGFQIKSGTTFKPWMSSAIRRELLNRKGDLHSEVKRLAQRHGYYTIICTGHDLTPEQRNESRNQIAKVFAEVGFENYAELIDVLGASQIAEFAERYPGTASLLTVDPIQEAWVLDEWLCDAHLTNTFEASEEQSRLITEIRASLQGETKHIRILGEPGLGKTRIALESVKDKNIASYVLYVQHGSRFGQTKLFRQLLKTGHDKPLVLVIDELPEPEMIAIWRHLKPRCGNLKIISLDHGRDETHDEEITRLTVPLLPDETIKKILTNRVGESRELDRWVAICEGSPRVAQAVADNLHANPSDVLKPPSTVPLWARFLHGYGSQNDGFGRQVDCVTQHLALFSRFGYEAPVGDEAKHISELIRKVDPTIGWARFQEIVQNLRARKVLQGSRTLFFVPKALHIYLWKQFWVSYGRGFNFTQIFKEMPASLHAWFLNMFKFAENASTDQIINDILKLDGIFSDRTVLTSEKGARFLSTLAEANPAAVLRLLEATIGKWADQELLDFKENRQNLVWALEKVAVWPTLTVRPIQVLSRLAVNENAGNSNNATGTLIGLFRIGPEAAATESTPEARLPAMMSLLRTPRDTERRLGLKAMAAALNSRDMGYRIVGPEYQGLKARAKLWIPTTYGEWWGAYFIYFQTLIDETKSWPSSLRSEVCDILLEAVKHQIRIPPCTDLAFQVLGVLVDDSLMSPGRLNSFFWNWQEYEADDQHLDIAKRLKIVELRYTRRDLASRFQRYVIDVDWIEWDESFREKHNKPKNRAKILVNSLARRIAQHPEKLRSIQHLLAPTKNTPALWHFGEQLALNDMDQVLLPSLIQLALATKHQVCLHGYLSAVQASNPELYTSTVIAFLGMESTAWLGTTIAIRSDYDDGLFMLCLDALEKKWIDPLPFSLLRFGEAIKSVPPERTGRLFRQLNEYNSQESLSLLLDLLDSISLDDSAPFNSDFVFEVILKLVPGEKKNDVMHGYHWKNICLKLIKWDTSRALPLLDALLTKMNEIFSLSYDSNVELVTNELVRTNPAEAWKIITMHFEATLPKWRGDLLHWLKGGLSGSDEKTPHGVIADLPIPEVLEWIEEDPENRAALVAHAALGTLDDAQGGRLTRELICRYGQIDGVRNGISATFHSGTWTGPTSIHLKKQREKFRQWLAVGFEHEVTQWIEIEIERLDRQIEHEEINEERSRFD